MSIDSSGNSPRNATGSPTAFTEARGPQTDRSTDDWRQKSATWPETPADQPSRQRATEDLLSKSKDAALTAAKALTSQATELAGNIGNELTHTAEEQKGQGADAMRGFARAAHGAANELDGQSPTVARYIRGAADSVEGLSDTIRSRSVNDLVAAATDTARTHPAAFFIGAVAAGFALSRFFKSTSRPSDAPQGSSAKNHEPGLAPPADALEFGERT